MIPDPQLLLTPDGPASGFLSTLPMLAAFGAIFYFMLLRPQQKEAAAQAQLVSSLQKGDRVVTSGGIHGRISEAKGDTLVLEISSNAFLTVDRDSVRKKAANATPEAS